MRKFIALLLFAAMVLSLGACSSSEPVTQETPTPTPTPTATPAPLTSYLQNDTFIFTPAQFMEHLMPDISARYPNAHYEFSSANGMLVANLDYGNGDCGFLLFHDSVDAIMSANDQDNPDLYSITYAHATDPQAPTQGCFIEFLKACDPQLSNDDTTAILSTLAHEDNLTTEGDYTYSDTLDHNELSYSLGLTNGSYFSVIDNIEDSDSIMLIIAFPATEDYQFIISPYDFVNIFSSNNTVFTEEYQIVTARFNNPESNQGELICWVNYKSDNSTDIEDAAAKLYFLNKDMSRISYNRLMEAGFYSVMLELPPSEIDLLYAFMYSVDPTLTEEDMTEVLRSLLPINSSSTLASTMNVGTDPIPARATFELKNGLIFEITPNFGDNDETLLFRIQPYPTTE